MTAKIPHFVEKLSAQNELFHRVGRFSIQDDALSMAWSGCSLSGSFKGSALAVELECRINFTLGEHLYLSVEIDGQKSTLKLNQAKTEIILASDLKEDLHTFKILRENEPFCGNLLAHQFKTDGQFVETKKKALLIEAIGDSIITGYGNESLVPHDSFNSQTQKITRSMVYLAAESSNADLRVIGHSGRGIYSNFDGDQKNNIKSLYLNESPYLEGTHDFANERKPDLVLFQIGTNDFANHLPPHNKFILNYVDLVKTVVKNNPDAQLLTLVGPILNDDWPISPITGQPISSLTLYDAWTDEVIGILKGSGIILNKLVLTPQEASRGYGANWHPNLLQHQLNSVEIKSAFKKLLDR